MMTKLSLAALAIGGMATTAAAAPAKDISMSQLKDLKWSPLDPKAGDKGPQLSVLWGDLKAAGKPVGFYMKFPAGFKPGPHTHTSDYCAVVVQGTMHDWKTPGTDEGPAVTVGGNWCQPGGQPHDNECEASSKDGCIILVEVPGGFDFKPVAAAPAKK